MVAEILNFVEVQKSIYKKLKGISYDNSEILQKLNIEQTVFDQKMKENNFSATELLKFAEILEETSVNQKLIMESIKRGEEDYINGRFKDFDEIEKLLKNRYQL